MWRAVAVGMIAVLGIGCTSADESDVEALGELDPDTCLPTDPPDDPGGAVDGVTSDDDEVVTEITEQVATIRELDVDQLPEPTFVDEQALAETVESFRTADLLDVEQRLFAAIGAIPPGLDVQAEIDAFETSFAGFYVYDPPLVLVRQQTPGQLDPVERLILAHEMLHALSNQEIGFPLEVLRGDAGADAALAALAVTEGEATVLESLWSSLYLADADRAELTLVYDDIGLDRDLPHIVQRRAAFPYVEGRAHVCEVYRDGGWPAVDALYTDVPTSTAEILGAPRIEAQPPTPVDDPGDDWVEIGRATVGAAELQWLFEAPGDDRGAALDDPLERALAWGGGETTVWTDTSTGERDIVALALVDGGERPEPLCESVDTWQTAAFPDAERSEQDDHIGYARADADAVLVCTDDEVLLVVADDADIARQLAQVDAG